MDTPHTLRRARTAWLAGDPDAWARYLACLRRIDAARPAPRRASVRRPRRRRARA